MSRLRVVLPALWAGVLACVGLIATPAPFAALSSADAGRVVARILAHEAYVSLALGVVVLLLERQAAQRAAVAGHGSLMSRNMVLALGTLFCTVAGYFAIQPLMDAARAGQVKIPFAVLHAVSSGFFVLKAILVLALAWRVAGNREPATVRA
jgi:hypothetical protein